MAPTIDALTSSDDGDDLVHAWRRENARAVRRFLDHALDPPAGKEEARPDLQLSARNQIRGTVTSIRHGDVMSTVSVRMGDGQPLMAAITKDAALELDLAPGDAVLVIVKSTEAMVAKAPSATT